MRFSIEKNPGASRYPVRCRRRHVSYGVSMYIFRTRLGFFSSRRCIVRLAAKFCILNSGHFSRVDEFREVGGGKKMRFLSRIKGIYCRKRRVGDAEGDRFFFPSLQHPIDSRKCWDKKGDWAWDGIKYAIRVRVNWGNYWTFYWFIGVRYVLLYTFKKETDGFFPLPWII